MSIDQVTGYTDSTSLESVADTPDFTANPDKQKFPMLKIDTTNNGVGYCEFKIPVPSNFHEESFAKIQNAIKQYFRNLFQVLIRKNEDSFLIILTPSQQNQTVNRGTYFSHAQALLNANLTEIVSQYNPEIEEIGAKINNDLQETVQR